MFHATYVFPTGDAEVDGLLFGTRWGSGAGVSVTYSFPGLAGHDTLDGSGGDDLLDGEWAMTARASGAGYRGDLT